jgi:hypothetical protein
MACKGHFARCFRFLGIFDPALLTIAPLTFSLVHLQPPTPPSLCQSTVYAVSVSLGGGGGGVKSCWRPYSAGEFNTLHVTRFRTYKKHPKQNPRRGLGLRQKKNDLPQSPFTGKFF